MKLHLGTKGNTPPTGRIDRQHRGLQELKTKRSGKKFSLPLERFPTAKKHLSHWKNFNEPWPSDKHENFVHVPVGLGDELDCLRTDSAPSRKPRRKIGISLRGGVPNVTSRYSVAGTRPHATWGHFKTEKKDTGRPPRKLPIFPTGNRYRERLLPVAPPCKWKLFLIWRWKLNLNFGSPRLKFCVKKIRGPGTNRTVVPVCPFVLSKRCKFWCRAQLSDSVELGLPPGFHARPNDLLLTSATKLEWVAGELFNFLLWF